MFFITGVTMLKILAVIVLGSCVLTQGETIEKMDVFRLPNDTEPISYRLNIKPIVDPKANLFTFDGDVTINIMAKTSTKELTLNAFDLFIKDVSVIDAKTSLEINTTSVSLVIKNEQLKIQLDDPGLITDREYIVKILYSGNLRNDMTGFYRSSYLDKETNTTTWLTVTQFEPTYARRAFPCYDEPAFKTPFSIFVTRKDTEISLSNMPRERYYQVNSVSKNYICDQYQTSKPMSTYLVAFSVSEFTNGTNQRVNVYTHKDYIDQVTYIAEKSNKLLNLMEIYTNIPYPYAKTDLLALPDFSSGAMENWGLNTYREAYLLVTNKSSEKDKELVTTVVQHELSHQWFGDLVTCSWWNYLWLNEAFATLFEYFAVNMAEPEWRVGDMFIIEQHQKALSYDHVPRHAITTEVNSPDEIQNIFDIITYSKGASVLRMLKFALTDDIFRKSLSSYLNTYKYKSAEPINLWDSFDNVLFDSEEDLKILGNKITVGEFMSAWIDQNGYPVINVETYSDNKHLIVTQKPFRVDLPKEINSTLWYIGLTYTTQKNPQFKNLLPSVWMNKTESKILIPITGDEGWIIFNLQSTGFYRVNYGQNNWERLIAILKSNPKIIHVLNRAQLIDDSFNLARAAELPYTVPLTLIEYLDKEDDFIPWHSFLNSISYMVKRLRRCSHTGSQMQTFAKKYAEIVYKKVSHQFEKKNGKHLTNTSMNTFSNWACKLEVEACVQSALKYFNEWQKNGVEIPPDVKQAAFCVGVQNGTENTWNNIFELFKNTPSTSERQAALLALACSTNTTILSKYLNLLIDTNCPIRSQDYKTVFVSLAATPAGINVTTDFLRNKMNKALDSMWEGENMIKLMFGILASSVSTSSEINELNLVRNLTDLPPTLKESFDESYKEVEFNSAYFMRAHPELHEWFSPTNKVSSSAISIVYTNAILSFLLYLGIALLNNNYSCIQL